MYAGPLRFLRALTVSATCVALSFAAHRAGAGPGRPVVTVVAGVGLLMVSVLLTLVLAALSSQRWTLGRSLVALALGQLALNAIFTVLLTTPHRHDPALVGAGMPMVLAHSVAALLIGAAIAASDSAFDTYFCVASSRVGSGVGMVSPLPVARLVAAADALAAGGAESRGARLARRGRPRILVDLVVLQCLSRRGPPALALAS